MDNENDGQIFDENMYPSEPGMQARGVEPKFLLVLRDKDKNIETKFTLETGKEIIGGADPECAIHIDDEYLSYRHFSIKAEGNIVLIQDLGSRNGLFLKIDQAAKIIPGQSILAGKTLLRLEKENG